MLHSGPQKNKHRIPELLAPAGSIEAFRAGVAAGADAVYLGGKQFGARKYAKNFSREEIAEAVTYAHAHGVRVYVTVNTLIHDRELAKAGDYLIWLYATGVDAVLVQDIGIAALAKKVVPDLPLHASTQLTIHNSEGVLWAAEHGFSRVVLARELSLEEIQEIARETVHADIGLEVFAHGALCYCYSGQCLLSSVIGGRSGNRGMCAQPCRKPYTMVTGEMDIYGRPLTVQDISYPEHYLLSPKDLCTYPHLQKLVQSPIVSLKIEGRMKAPEYVAVVVSIYRKALDAIAAGTWSPQEPEIRDLALAFNRGFTGGYLFGERNAALMGRKRPDNRGLMIGIVTKYNTSTGMVTFRSQTPIGLAKGDGLFFTTPNHSDQDFGFSLNIQPCIEPAGTSFKIPRPVERGSFVFLTSSKELAAQAHRIIARAIPPPLQRIPIDLAVQVDDEGRLLLDGIIYTREAGQVTISYAPVLRLSHARTSPLTAGQFKMQLTKTGGTPFTIHRFTTNYNGGMFAPVSGLNQIRREFLIQAEKALVNAERPSEKAVKKVHDDWDSEVQVLLSPAGHSRNYPDDSPELAVYTDHLEGVRAAVTAGCNILYFEPKLAECTSSYSTKVSPGLIQSQLRSALAICKEGDVALVWKLQKITHKPEIEMIRALLPTLHTDGIASCMVDSTGAACAVRDTMPNIEIVGSTGLNVFNHRTACNLAPQFSRLTISPELSGSEIEDLIRLTHARGCDTRFELIVQGTAEAMVSEDCLIEPLLQSKINVDKTDKSCRFLGIRDSTRRIFPIRIDPACRTHVFNAVETCLIDHIPALLHMGVSSFAIDARGRPAPYTTEMVRLYRSALTSAQHDGSRAGGSLMHLKEQIKGIALGGITAGNFVRGLREV
jgi:putative protease